MADIVFGEKIRRPAARGLVRDRLAARLLDPDGPPAGLVLGPAGSGKTTLLSSIAETCSPSAWYRASGEDDDESSLVQHLATTLGAAVHSASIADCARTGSMASLLSALPMLPDTGALLVIDDLHELAGSAAEAALERFLELRPRRLRVLLAARRPPMINTSRLLVSGDLCQLDTDDLRFRSWEVEELFRHVYDRPLAPSAAAALTRRTGGWAAGLQMFHLATSAFSRPDRERAVDQLSGRSRLIRSYLARNVLGGLTPQRRSFLLRTCTLGILTGALCDQLLQTTGSAAVLDQLETEQFFTTSTDGGTTYRYHQVLQSHLEVMLSDEFEGPAVLELFARSGALLEQSGEPLAAARAYARAEDWSAVERLLIRTGALADHDRLRRASAASRLPGSPDDPMLALAGAHRMLRNGQLEPGISALRQAEALLDDPEFRRRCATERAAASVWLPQPDALQLDPGWSDRHDDSARVARELRRITRTSKPGLLTSGLARGVAALLAGEPGTTVRELSGVTAPQLGWQGLAVGLTGQLADYLDRRDPAAVMQIDDIVLEADAAGQTWLSRLARGVQAALLLADQPSPERLAAVQQVIDECDQVDDGWGACLLNCILGGVHRSLGQDDQARRALALSGQQADALGAPVLQVWAESARGSVPTPGSRTVRTGLNNSWRPVTSRPDDDHQPSELCCLGGFSLRSGHREVAWRSLRPRAQLLLMRLSMDHGHAIHREQLIDALWPDVSVPAATHRLQVAISSVRHCLITGGLFEDCLQRTGDAYALQLGSIHDQLHRFETLIDQARRLLQLGDAAASLRDLLQAVDLYRGDLLPEVGPADWVVEERDRLRVLAGAAAADAARLASETGDLTVGIRSARRSIDLDPYHDPAWQLLITLQERSGDRTGAMITERDHARVRADLGVLA